MNWGNTRLKWLFAAVTGGSWGHEPGESDVDALCIRGTDFDYMRLRVDTSRAPTRGFSKADVRSRAASRGDIIIEKSGGGEQQPVGRAVLWDGDEMVLATNFAARLRPSTGTDPRFATYLLAGMWFDGRTRTAIKQTTGIQNLDLGALLDHRVGCPPLAAQRCIADYLDRETARLDALTVAKKRLIALLAERRQATIDETFMTNGPTIRVKHLVSRITSGPRGWAEYTADQGVLFLRIANVSRSDIELDMANTIYVEPPVGAERRRTAVCVGDVLVTITADIGSVGVARAVHAGAAVSQHVALLTPRLCSGDWLAYALSTSTAKSQQQAARYGGTKTQLGLDDVANIVVPLVSIGDQAQVVADLASKLDAIRAMQDKLAAQVRLVSERREALITAAVTGQLDVPLAA